jgi:hypothetical protein
MSQRTQHSSLGAPPAADAVRGAVLSLAPLPAQRSHRTLLRCCRAAAAPLLSHHRRAAQPPLARSGAPRPLPGPPRHY